MFRALTAPSNWEAGKWLACALFLLAPGSFVVLIVWWLARMGAGRALYRLTTEGEHYLAEAGDLPDLERRMRLLERASGGPAFVTFNH